MRVASFIANGEAGYGLLSDAQLRPVSRATLQRYPDLKSVLAADALHELSAAALAEPIALDAVELLPPVPRPDKILCVGVNYRPHIEEMGRSVPDYPVVFVRFAASLVGHNVPLHRPSVSAQFDYEGELAVIIGRSGRFIAPDRALEHVAAVAPFMDGSVRDWQRHTPQFTPGKNFDRSGSMGPALVTLDETGPLASLTLETRLNGETVQSGRLGDLLFDVPAIIAYCSTFCRLEPGDIIATGTPGGVGAARRPPLWLQPGDRIEVDLGPAGSLLNPVIDAPSDP